MAFKKPPTRTRSKSKTAEAEVEEKVVDSEISGAVWGGIAALGSIIAMVGILLVSAPHTHAAPTVNYSGFDLANGALSSGLLPEYKEKLEAKKGIDFRLILRRANQERTPAMQRVAQACLPDEPFNSTSLPGKGVHKVFADATDYLICAMGTEQARFCDSAERKRLAKQLIQYRDRQQNALAVERARDRMLGSKSAQYQMKQMQMVMEISGKAPVAAPPRVGEDIDPRVTAGVGSLVQNGYFSASDFGWMGLYLPEEYVDVLQAPATAEPACI